MVTLVAAVRCESLSPSEADYGDDYNENGSDGGDHLAMEEGKREKHDEKRDDSMDVAPAKPYSDSYSDDFSESDSSRTFSPVGSDSERCSGTKRPCEENDARASDSQPWKMHRRAADRCSVQLIVFLRSFARNSIDYYPSYDARRVSLKAILREAREKDLHYEKMDAPAAVAHNPTKLCIDWNGPQLWYLELGRYRNKTILLSGNIFDSGIRIALAVLGHYDSRRPPLDAYLDTANMDARHHEALDSPVPHDPFCPVVHDHANYLHSKKLLLVPRSLTSNIVAAGLAHYDSRRVSESKFVHHRKMAEERYFYADIAAAYAEILAKQPTFDIKKALNTNLWHALDKHGALASDINEQWLFHGTTYNNADSIVRSGFDLRTCKRGMYGDGLYFASEACKGNQYTCSRHTGVNDVCTCKCERTMIVARVALGEPFYATATLPNQRRPPERRSGHRVYDSIIANPGPMKGHFNGRQEHQEFVIFNMEQAYPSFVVQYELS